MFEKERCCCWEAATKQLRFFARPGVAYEFEYAGHERDGNDRQNHKREIMLYNRNIAEEIACKNTHRDPGCPTENIIADKAGVCHPADAGYKRGESAHNRDKAGNDYCLSAIFLVELVSALQVLPVQEAHIFPVEHLWTGKISYPVIRSIARHSGED